MISIKTGVNSYANRPGFGAADEAIAPNSAKQTRTSSASEYKDLLGDTPIGDYLNQIADPNYVDPSKKMRTAGKNELDRDAFFKLMIQQMKQQDPTNPLQSHEMAAQLAQFSSIEQLGNINTTLSEMKQEQKPSLQFQALGMIGKVVSGDAAQVIRSEGDKIHELQFDLPVDAPDVKVTVKNELGEPVRTFQLKNLKPGPNGLTWNGLQDNGTAARPGNYRFEIDAKSSVGKKLHVKTDFSGEISGVNFTAQGPILLVGEKTIRLSDVRKIVDADIKAKSALPNIPLVPQAVPEVLDQIPAAQTEAKGNILNGVAMEGDMMNRFVKETN